MLLMCKERILLALFSTFISSFVHGAIIQVSLSGQTLSNAMLTDGNGVEVITDEDGIFETESNDCITLLYTDLENVTYRSMAFCDLDDSTPLFKLNMEKSITLSGTVNVPEACNCNLIYSNLDAKYEIQSGTGLRENKTSNFSRELPAGRYRISVYSLNYRSTPDRHYVASVSVDARAGSVEGIKISSVDGLTSRHPGKPPRADLISVRHLDSSHLSFVEGEAGSAGSLVRVSLVNLQTGQGVRGFSEPDGSFSIKFFAPPGAAIQVSQDFHSPLSYNDFSGQSPSTVIYVPTSDPSMKISTGQRLNGSRQNDSRLLDIKGGKDPGIAWLTGSLDSNEWQAGSSGTLSGTVDIYSRNLDYGAVPTLSAGTAMLELLIDADGRQKAAQPQYAASDLTVTRMPIERAESQSSEAMIIGQFTLSDYELVGSGHGRATWSLEYQVPTNAPDGVYQLVLTGQGWSMNPWISGLTSERLFYEDVYFEPSFHLTEIHGAARIYIGQTKDASLYPAILFNEISNGSRGTISTSDRENFAVSGHWVANADKLILPRSTKLDGSVKKYNIEPFIPLTAFSNKEWLNPPKIPLSFPTGQLSATVRSPKGTMTTIGPYSVKGSSVQIATTELGEDLFRNSNSPGMTYALTTYSDDFDLVLDDYGEYVITLDGSVRDIYGDTFSISGEYSVFIAETLDIETGVFPGTPFEVGDQFSPSVIVQPGVPAEVTVTLQHYPNSIKNDRIETVVSGVANRFGYFSPNQAAFIFEDPGEYLANYEIEYTSPEGVLWMASRRWASVVETPSSKIYVHGHRGDEGGKENRQWYLMEDTSDNINAHFFSPYQIGDVMWTKNSTSWNAAMQNIVTLDDGDGALSALVSDRDPNGLDVGSMDLVSTSGTDVPAFVDPNQSGIHWGYYYTSIGRPGVSVRDLVGSATTTNAYWRFNTPYGYQLGSGVEGDQPNDFKFIFGGSVYRAPDSSFQHYGAYGSFWAMLPESDHNGGRVMPPFQGAAGGPSGGPLFTLKGEEIDIFIHPQSIRPGSILEVGDNVSFSGQIAPTLPSEVQITITSPSGKVRSFGGTANKVGYYFNSIDDYAVSEPGVHNVSVVVTHRGLTSAGQVEPPFPSGSVLGSASGEFSFYVQSGGILQAGFVSNLPEKLPLNAKLSLELKNSDDSSPNIVDYTAVMPGFILDQKVLDGPSVFYDAFALNESFPNLDLPGGSFQKRAGADTVTLSFLTRREGKNGQTTYEGRQLLIQGEQIYAPSHQRRLEGTFDITMRDSELIPGEKLTASVDFNAKGDADIYVAVFLPSGDFITINENLALSGIGEIIPFTSPINLEKTSNLPIVDVGLDSSVAPGEYRLIVLATTAGKNVYDQAYWLGFEEVNFSFLN